VQVWISGHVPPSSDNFFPDCYVRYTELSLRYQDTILGHLYGHMNADHFFFLQAEELQGQPKGKKTLSLIDADGPHDESHKGLYKTLLKDFEDLPKTSKNMSYDDYGVVNVSPSVVPNPYLPSFRIFTYNATGSPYIPASLTEERKAGRAGDGTGAAHCLDNVSSDAHPDSWRCKLFKPWYSSPDSPSRTNRLWTPLGYAQYYIPKLESADKKHPPKVKLEYLTFPVSLLHPARAEDEATFWYPIPLRHLPKSLRNATVTASKFAPYGLADLTIASWTDLAQRLAVGAERKLRKRFRKYMYMGTDEG